MPGRLQTNCFEAAQCVRRAIPVDNHVREVDVWYVVGLLEDKSPFLMTYQGGMTSYACAVTLGEALRRKILRQLKTSLFNGDPRLKSTLLTSDAEAPFVLVHDLREVDRDDIRKGNEQAGELCRSFVDQIWRAQYLNERDEDYLDLNVPFADKAQVKALGAQWDSHKRVWRVRKQDDMSAFARWLS